MLQETRERHPRFPPFKSPTGSWILPAVAWCVLLGAALLLRLVAIDSRGLWGDEAWRIWAARLPTLWDVLHVAWAQPPSAPLYWLGLHFWVLAFGHGDVAARLFSVLPSTACVGAIYSLASRLGGSRSGWIAAGLLGVSPLAVEVGQEATMYAWSMLAATLALAAGWRWLTTGQGGARYVALGALLIYLHYLGPLLLAWFCLAGLLLHSSSRRFGTAAVLKPRKWIRGHLLLAALWLPWAIPMFLRIGERWPELRQLRHPAGLAELYAAAAHVIMSASPQAVWPRLWVAAAVAACGSVVVWAIWRAPHPAAPGLCVLVAAGTIGSLIGSSALTGAWLYQPRFLSLILPLLLCALSLGLAAPISRGARRVVPALLVTAWVGAQIAGLVSFYYRPVHGRDGLREIGAWLQQESGPADVIVGNHPYLLWGVAQYFPGPLRGLPSDWDVRQGYPLLPPPQPQWVQAQITALPQIAGSAPRLWLIYLPIADPDGTLLESVQRSYRLEECRSYPLLTVYRFDSKGGIQEPAKVTVREPPGGAAPGATIMNSGGTFDASGKMLTTSGRMDDLATGKVVTMRERMTCSSNDEVLFEMWGPGPDGKDNRMMEIRYTRKK